VALFRPKSRTIALAQMPTDVHSLITWEAGHVRAAVLRLGQGTAELAGVAAAPVNGISRTAHPDVDRWAAGCDRALSQAEEMTTETCGAKIVSDYVTMCLPAEITQHLTLAASAERLAPARPITAEELVGLIRRGYRKAQDIVGARTRQITDEIIYGSVVGLKVDDQAVSDAMGLHGRKLEAQFGFYLAPAEWVRALEVVAARLQVQIATLVPHHVAYASPLPDASALMVLLDEHHTLVCLVRYGHIIATATAARGQREIINATASVLKLQDRQADALLRAYRARQLRDDLQMYLARAFWAELRRWMSEIAVQVKGLAPGEPVPQHIYLADLTRALPEAIQSLETPFWEQCIALGCCPKVTPLQFNIAHQVLDCTSQANGPAFLLLRALAHQVAQLYTVTRSYDRALVEGLTWRRGATPSFVRSR
jgi:hypothetical protein